MNVPARQPWLRSCDWFVICTTLIVCVARSSGLLVRAGEDSLFVSFLSLCTLTVLIADIIGSALWMVLTLSTEPFVVDDNEDHPIEERRNGDADHGKLATIDNTRGKLSPRKRGKVENKLGILTMKKGDEKQTTKSAPQLSNISEVLKTTKSSRTYENKGANSPPNSPLMKISPFNIIDGVSTNTTVEEKDVNSDSRGVNSTLVENVSLSSPSKGVIPPKSSTTIVIDIGSTNIRCGFAGESDPVVKIKSSYAINEINKHLTGDNINKDRIGLVSSSSLYDRSGRVVCAENHCEVIKYVYSFLKSTGIKEKIVSKDSQSIDSSKHPLLVCWPAFGSLEDAVKITQRLIRELNIPLIHYALAPVLSLYGSGRQTGCSVLSGDMHTTTVCVLDGLALQETLICSLLAGKYVTENLSKKLGMDSKGGSPLTGDALRDVKERIVVCFKSRQHTAARGGNHVEDSENDSHKDHTVAKEWAERKEPLSMEERMHCAEGLFRRGGTFLHKSGDSLSTEPLQNAVQTSIANAQKQYNIRSGMWGNIVLAGGNAKIKNLPERLENELMANAHHINKEPIGVSIASGDSANAVWLGGSVLANLDDFGESHWVSAGSFLENPRESLAAKCQFLVSNDTN